jgi:hypothetical protein
MRQRGKTSRAGQAADDNMAHAHYVLDTQGYKYTHRLCSTHGSPSSTTVARKRLNVRLLRILSVSFFLYALITTLKLIWFFLISFK